MIRGAAWASSAMVLLATLWAVAGVLAHPFHVSLTEAEYNPETHSLEVALRVLPADLERALELRLGRDIDLDREPELERWTREYVAERFVVRDRRGAVIGEQWVGMELDLRDAWLFFELPLPDGTAGVEISNRVFFELEETQVNSINVRLPAASTAGRRRALRTLTLSADHPSETLR